MSMTTTQMLARRRSGVYQRVPHLKGALISTTGHQSMWNKGILAGTTPTTAAVPTNATAGSMGQEDSDGVQRIVGAELSPMCGLIDVIDRLSHQAGLDGAPAGAGTAQTTNLPTAALTRFTSGVGVQIGLEIYTQIGATSTTVKATYTNSGGTGGRNTTLVQLGNSGFREANRFIWLPLQAGDLGAKSVESVTITDAGGTGTVGNFGVTLFKFLFPIIIMGESIPGNGQVSWDPILGSEDGGGGFPVPAIPNLACVGMLPYQNRGSSNYCGGMFMYAED